MLPRFAIGLVSISLVICCLSASNTYATTSSSGTVKSKSVSSTQSNPANVAVSNTRKAERMYYMEAQKALDKKQWAQYQQMLPNLKNYPLLPYLEYQELGDRLMSLPKKEVEQFFIKYPDSYIAERLKHRWLRALAIKELWADYLHFYDANLTDPELACLNIRARIATGDKTALADIEPLWNIDKQQPKACDPIIAQWKAAGYLTPALLWSRHLKAVKTDEMSLATSIAVEMEPAQQAQALLYENVAKNPRLILQPDKFNTQTPEERASIVLGLERYAQTDAEETADLWKIYSHRGNFTTEENARINYTIARQLLRQDHGQAAEQLVAVSPDLSHPDLLEALIREALHQQDWGKAYKWILRLPADSRKTERWRYWEARIMEQLKIREANGKSPHDIYVGLANTRGFYGFLSSDKLGLNYSLLDNPLNISKDLLAKIEFHPGIQRAKEFYLLGDIAAATREWTYTTHHFPSTEEMVAAGHIADHWGWYRQAIQTMQDSDYLDDLAPRFPIPFHENVKAAARQTSIDPHFILAITKQESAFNTGALSPVGAMGLMQLMPTTAKTTAKKAGLLYKPQDLLQADKNIVLGSRYLDELMNGFAGNRILAAAAYNAGPSRVKQWMNKEDNKLQYDVWIETIPYKETRLYVQNILSFAVIYAYRTGNVQPFITPQEAAQTL